MKLCLAAPLALLTLGSVFAQTEPLPQWIWAQTTEVKQVVFFRKTFELKGGIARAVLVGACDNEFTAVVNGERVLQHARWQEVAAIPVETFLHEGRNVVAIRAKNYGGEAGLFCRFVVTFEDGSEFTDVSDGSWKAKAEKSPDWNAVDLDDSHWDTARTLGAVGGENVPWTAEVTLASLDQAVPSPMAETASVSEATGITLLPGFKAELVYAVPRETQGSWVAMTTAPDGGLFVSDQQNAGIYHVRPAPIGADAEQTTVSRLPVGITAAQGLLWAFDRLYVSVNQEQDSGLYEVTDANGDGQLDTAAMLQRIEGQGEHGPHAVILSEDRTGLYVNAGNVTLPPPLSGSRAPRNWAEDLLLPRQWDPRGHAKGRLAPGGWICRVTPDGQDWDLFGNGFRNEYDIALNPEGELFTYDADMEWDMGLPWYRPTRVCHVVSGAEFGWRSGTGKWPPYYEDSLPPVVEIGPGSPTGVLFGTGAKFPATYQHALYILDWTFGTIYAVHLIPRGASYLAEKEEFLSGTPLAVTDAVIGADGAFYFTVGGRGSQSALYRVYYTGKESTDPAQRVDPKASREARALRHHLETYHGVQDPAAVADAWPHLGSADRFIRFAARIAVESQPVATWQERALEETNAQAAAVALIALSRQGDAEAQPRILDALGRFDLAQTSETETLGLLRAYALCFARMGRPDQHRVDDIAARLSPCLPSASDWVNTELLQVLVYLDAPGVVDQGLALMAAARPTPLPDWGELIARNERYGGTIQAMLENLPPAQKINYALALRNVRYGWTLEQRESYFRFISEAAAYPGGASYSGYLMNIRDDALRNCSEAEAAALAPITGQSLISLPDFEIVAPTGTDRPWTLETAYAAVQHRGLEGRDFNNGRNGYHAAGCVVCHRFDGNGGAIGPDLSNVSNKFSIRDLLESIVEPSKNISDQYGSSEVALNDGTVLHGIVVKNEESDARGEMQIYTSDPNAEPIVVNYDEVESIQASKLSQMPAGLADMLSEDELLDLLAYLMSRGNAQASLFK